MMFKIPPPNGLYFALAYYHGKSKVESIEEKN